VLAKALPPRDEIWMVLLICHASAVNNEEVVGPVIMVEVNVVKFTWRAEREVSVSKEKGPRETGFVAPV
jgi:hypothetical protein